MQRLRAWLRTHWLIALVIIAIVVFVLLNLNQIRGIVTTLAQGSFVWVGAAIVLQIDYYGLFARLYHLGFGAVGVGSRTIELIPILLVARIIQLVIPTGGASALAVFVADAVRRNQSGTRAAE